MELFHSKPPSPNASLKANVQVSQLISSCQKGDRRAQRELFYRYSKQVMYVAYRYTHDQQLAEDAVQETFINVYKYISNVQATSENSLLSWMNKIAARESIRILKKRQRIDLSDEHPAQTRLPSAPELLRQGELLRVIAQLPCGYRSVLQMYAIDGFTHDEIASELGITVSTSRSQLTRARQMLKARWNTQKEYYVQSE